MSTTTQEWNTHSKNTRPGIFAKKNFKCHNTIGKITFQKSKIVNSYGSKQPSEARIPMATGPEKGNLTEA